MFKRVIPSLLFDETGLVKGRRFGDHRPAGSLEGTLRALEANEPDELLLLNRGSFGSFLEAIKSLGGIESPVSVGGGVETFLDARDLFQCGADRVCLNTMLMRSDKWSEIDRIIDVYGSQAVVAVIDLKVNGGDFAVFDWRNLSVSEERADEYLGKIKSRFMFNEICITVVDSEGCMSGIDQSLKDFAPLNDPQNNIILGGGVGDYDQLSQFMKFEGVSAIHAGALFTFTDSSPKRAAAYLSSKGIATKHSLR